MVKKIFLALVIIIFVFGEVSTLSKPNRAIDTKKDFLISSRAPENIKSNIRSACYDCHSHETKYLWYNYIFPIGNWSDQHVENGLRHLNFSTWTDYGPDKRKHKVEECIEMIEDGSMPLPIYVKMHPEADLSEEDKQAILRYLNSRKNQGH